MNKFRKFLQSVYGKLIISFILGFGLSTLFRKSCKGIQCLRFEGPPLDKIKGTTYSYGNQCYAFKPNPVKCNPNKKTVRFA